MKCPGCNKFATFDMSNAPEMDSLDVVVDIDEKEKDKGTAAISGDTRIVLTSECCSEELKEANFEIDIQDVEVEKHKECACTGEEGWAEEASVDTDGDAEITDRAESSKTKTYKRGPKAGQTVQVPIPSPNWRLLRKAVAGYDTAMGHTMGWSLIGPKTVESFWITRGLITYGTVGKSGTRIGPLRSPEL